jgi:hypothetical protein
MITDGMKAEDIRQEANRECECRPALPDGREFEMCVPCKVRQDIERKMMNSVLDLEDVSDGDFPWELI